MYRTVFIVALLLVIICSARGSIDFTPVVEEYTSQGFVFRKVSLKEEKGMITFVPPRDWKVRGGKDLLQLDPNKNFAEATISAAPLSGPAPLNEAMVEALKQQVLQSAPPSSQSAQVVRCELNPVLMGPYQSVEIAISYATLGRTFEKSVLFVQAEDQQLVFRLTAPKEDFAPLSQAFRRSLGSWQRVQSKTSEPLTASK